MKRFKNLTINKVNKVKKLKVHVKSNKQMNLLTGKPVLRKSKVKKKFINSIKASVLIEDSNTIGILPDLLHLPLDARRILNNSTIISMKCTENNSIYILTNSKSLKVLNVSIGRHIKQRIIFKDKKNVVLDITIK